MVYNFEPVDYDYSHKHDEPPVKLQFGKYCDVPVRKQDYSYVRAQRMARAGATNLKIIHHGENAEIIQQERASRHQTPHSAKTLSENSMRQARRIHRAASARATRRKIMRSAPGAPVGKMHSRSMTDLGGGSRHHPHTAGSRMMTSPRATTAGSRRTRATTTAGTMRSRTSKSRSEDFLGGGPPRSVTGDVDITTTEYQRRVSWAYEHPFAPGGRELDLASTKSLLRSQIRAKGKVLPPDFVYLKVNSIQQSMKTPDPAKDDKESEKQQEEIEQNKKLGRPSSSPSKMDTRTKVPVSQLEWKHLLEEEENIPEDDGDSLKSYTVEIPTKRVPTQTTIVTEFDEVPVDAKPYMSVHSLKTKSSIPHPKLLRPHTATVYNSESYYAAPPNVTAKLPTGRFHSAPLRKPLGSAVSEQKHRPVPSSAQIHSHSRPISSAQTSQRPVSGQTTNTSQSVASEMGPMLMYSKDVFAKIEEMKQRRAERLAEQQEFRTHPGASGMTSKYNDPLRSHASFQLKTHEQEMQKIADIEAYYQRERERREAVEEKKHKAAWNAKVTGKSSKNFADRPICKARELCGVDG